MESIFKSLAVVVDLGSDSLNSEDEGIVVEARKRMQSAPKRLKTRPDLHGST